MASIDVRNGAGIKIDDIQFANGDDNPMSVKLTDGGVYITINDGQRNEAIIHLKDVANLISALKTALLIWTPYP